MIRALLILVLLASTILLPWWITAPLALIGAFLEPFAPLVVAILADALYLQEGVFPIYMTCYATFFVLLVLFIRNRLRVG